MTMSATERKAKLILAHVRQSDLARKLGLSYSHVTEVVRGRRRSPRVESEVAAVLGIPVEEVFGPRTYQATSTAS